jgi:hypothetical protein
MYCGNTIANGFGGVLAAGVLSGLDGAHGVEGWRWLYIIEGGGTMVVGAVAFCLLPDFPRSGKKAWLTEQQQRYAEWRIADSVNGEIDEIGSMKQGLKDTVTDIKVWLLVATQVCLLSSQTWTYFFPSIVQTLGYGKIRSLLLTSPVYVFGFFTSLGNSLIAQKTGHRAILIMWPLSLAIVGNAMVVASHLTAVRYTIKTWSFGLIQSPICAHPNPMYYFFCGSKSILWSKAVEHAQFIICAKQSPSISSWTVFLEGERFERWGT